MNRGSWIRKLANEVLDCLYPPGLYCICCGKIIDASRTYMMCNDCIRDMKWIRGRSCTKCGKALGDTDPGDVCYGCRNYDYSFDHGYACAEYGAHEKAVLYELKYASRGDIGKTLGEIVYDRMAAEFGENGLKDAYDLVIPIPIFKQRRKTRGFNQAEIIAKSFAERAGIPYSRDVLIRSKETLPMKGLGPSERMANIQGAFAIREELKEKTAGARLLLIDDIYTTGATLSEAARILKDAGASTVDFASFAAGADILLA
jgi:ComF family protein